MNVQVRISSADSDSSVACTYGDSTSTASNMYYNVFESYKSLQRKQYCSDKACQVNTQFEILKADLKRWEIERDQVKGMAEEFENIERQQIRESTCFYRFEKSSI